MSPLTQIPQRVVVTSGHPFAPTAPPKHKVQRKKKLNFPNSTKTGEKVLMRILLQEFPLSVRAKEINVTSKQIFERQQQLMKSGGSAAQEDRRTEEERVKRKSFLESSENETEKIRCCSYD